MTAIQWIFKNEERITSETHAEIMFHVFLRNNLICHASGVRQQFKRGYYLYCILNPENQAYFKRPRNEDTRPFQLDWMEVGVVPQNVQKDILTQMTDLSLVSTYKIAPLGLLKDIFCFSRYS